MIAGEHRLALPAGFRLGKYNLLSVLGAGGFGITYLAEDHSLGRRVAIKELLPNDIATRVDGSTVVAKTKSEEENLAWARDRFVQEGRALAACDHPNVVNVYEMIEANGTAYMVTKFEEGRSFSEWLKEVNGRPTEKELRAILLPLLSGLEKVHRAGFLHRDLKPENIYLTDDGRPILLDFGSARQAVNDRTTSLTSIVTSGYAPFEQYHEDGKQGAWSDLYALAAVMYRAIHGKKPPEATRRLKDDPCPRLAKEYTGKYSAQFLGAIDRALAVEPQKRPQSVTEWMEMLGAEPAGEKIVVPPWWQPWLEKLQHGLEWAKAKPAWAAGGAVGVLILLVALSRCGAHEKSAPPVPTPAPSSSVSSSPLPSASIGGQTAVVPPPYGAGTTDLNALVAHAAPGATIKVPPGVYPNLVVTRPVHLAGDPNMQVFIKGEGREALSVKSAGVSVQNIQFICHGIGALPAVSLAPGAGLQIDACTIQSGTALGLLATGKASVKATGTTFAVPYGTGLRLTEQATASLTQCSIADTKIGLNAWSGASAELHSCAFERDGGNDGGGSVLALSGQGTVVTGDDCRFNSNTAGLLVTQQASLAVTKSWFQQNAAGVDGGVVGLISVRDSARATFTSDSFESNRQGVAVTDGGTVEMLLCTLAGNGRQERQVFSAALPLLVSGEKSRATVRKTAFTDSVQSAIGVRAGGELALEDVDISGSRVAGVILGERKMAPVHAAIRRTRLNRNGTGLGLLSGSSAELEDCELRENNDGLIACDAGTRLKATRTAIISNRDRGLYIYLQATASLLDCDLKNNARGAMCGTRGRSAERASIALENCRFGGNRVFGAGANAQSELVLTNCVFDGTDKTNIYKERGANVQTNESPGPETSPAPRSDEQASPAPEESASPSPESSAEPSPTPGKSTPKPHHKPTPHPHPPTPDDLKRALRRLLPGGN